MKKVFAIITLICVLFAFGASAEETKKTFEIEPGITFGMSQQEVITALGNQKYKMDKEGTRGGFTYAEIEVEDTLVNGLKADIHYYFISDKLVAAKVDYDDSVQNAAVLDFLKAAYGDAAADFDLATLGKGIYAVDDDGIPEGTITSWAVENNVAIVMEQEKGETEVTVIDLSAEYPAA